jgi:tetratricopeptide (TPR) repeat protein
MITATLFMDVSGAIRSLNDFGSKLQGLSNLGNVFKGLNDAMSTLTAGIAAQFEKVHAAMHLGSELEELSLATGQSVRDLVVLRKAFALAGMAADEVAPMIARLQKALGGTNEMGEPTAKVFERIGLSVEKLKAQSAIQQLRSLQAAFASIHNPADRTKAAMDIFGKQGFKMGALLAQPQVTDTAEKSAGGFGRDMEGMAPTLKNLSVAVTELGDRWKKFYANLLVQIAPALEKFFEMLKGVNLGALGKQIGSALNSFAGFVQGINATLQKIPLLTHGLGSVAMGFVALKTLGPLVSKMFAGVGTSMRAMMVACSMSGGAMSALKLSFGSACAAMAVSWSLAMKAIKIAFVSTGIGLLIEGLVWAAQWAYQKLSKFMDNGKSGKAVADETSNEVHEYEEKFKKIGSEEERDALREEIENKRKIAEEEARTASNNDDPKAAALWDRVQAYEVLLRELKKVPKEVIAENAELKRQEIAAREAEKAVEELRKTVAKLGEEYDKLRAKHALEALPIEEQRKSILGAFGPTMQQAGETGLEYMIELLRKSSLPADAADLEKAVKAYEQILEINKKRVEVAERATEAETQHEEKILQLDAELAGNEALLRALKKQQKYRERVEQLRKAGVQNPEEMAAKEIGKEHKAEDKKTDEKKLEWKKKFALEMRKLDAQVRGDKAAERAAEREEKIEQYTKDAIAAHIDPDTARKAAILKVNQEQAAKDAEDAKKTSIFADTDRRIGLGGIAVQTRADPLVKAQQDNTRMLQSNNTHLSKLNDHLSKQPNTIVKPLVPLFQ